MYAVLLVATQGDPDPLLLRRLDEEGVAYTVVPDPEATAGDDGVRPLDAVLLDMRVCGPDVLQRAVELCQEIRVPLLCGLPEGRLAEYDLSWGASDFFHLPPSAGEVSARIRQAHGRDHRQAGKKVLEVGDLRIDLERYDVFSRGRRVLLTFKEYQLLCLLAANPGRVFSRESLLKQIWEYDYFGGTRTVDVHIRRLRSKIEDTGRVYIETVWNVGYRFRPQDADP